MVNLEFVFCTVMNRIKALVISTLFLASLQTQAQNLTFRQITSEDGISQSEVYCFLQDAQGYMWIGTLDGLNRYDGYTVQTFQMSEEDPNGLIHSTVFSLTEDMFGRIWIGTAEGLNVYDPEREQMLAVPNFFSGKQILIKALLADERDLWIGTSKGLFRMPLPVNQIDEARLKNLSAKTAHVDIEINGSPAIYSSVEGILKSSDGRIWLGTWEGLCCFDYDPEKKEHYQYYDLPEELINIESITCLGEDRNENLWFGTRSMGLNRYNRSAGNISAFTKDQFPKYIHDNIKSVISDNQGNLWVGSINGGILIMKAEHLLDDVPEMHRLSSSEFQPGSLNSNIIRSLYLSKEGIVWIGTVGSGINLYSPAENRFSLHRIPPQESTGEMNNFIRALYPESEEVVWLGLHNNGLYKYNARFDEYTRMRSDLFYTVFHIAPIDKEHLWIATGDGAHMVSIQETDVDVLNTVNFKETEDIPAYTASFNVERCTESVFFIAYISGIARVEVKDNYEIESTFYNEYSDISIPIRNVRVLLHDSVSNVLWAGSEGYGLDKIILNDDHFPVSFSTYQHIHGDTTSLSSNYIRSLCLDQNRDLWIGTYDGLNKAIATENSSSYKFCRWKKDDGLPNNMIQSIEEDSDGNLWLGTNGGLSKYITIEDRFFNYQISDGLQSNEFSEHTSFYSDDGKMYFGGINGFNVFVPEQIPSFPVFPTVKLTDFYLRNQLVKAGEEINKHILLDRSIDHTDSLVLRPGENDLRFDFSSMHYSNPGKFLYMYKLEGYDQDWIVTDAMERNANYTNLPSGKYQFRVKASNSKGLWDDNSTSLHIQIKTPYALRWWAFVIYLVLFVLGVLYFTRYSIIKITTKRRLVLDNEHNQRLHELDLLRTRFFVNISHDLRTPLTLITGPLDNILKNFNLNSDLRNQIELIKRSAKRLRYLIEQLLDMRKVEEGKLNPCPSPVDLVKFIKTESEYFDFAMKRNGIRFSIECSEPVIEAWIDPDMIGKVIFNLLSNAIKYTKNGQISVHVSRSPVSKREKVPDDYPDQELVRIEIIDNGKGISKEKMSKIFERFYQDPEHPGSGYGIGLSHTKELIDAHNGTIEVQSEEGQCTKFTIHLPILYQFESKTIQEECSVKKDFKTVEPEIVQDGQNESEPEPSESGDKKCILIVEDNVDLQTYLVSSLSSEYKTLIASDGEEGLSITFRETPDLIVSDINMPNMDGYEFCARVKTAAETSHIPVILLTARVDDDSKYRGLDTGADDYITKPFDVEYLLLRIKNILKTREHLRELFQRNVELEPSAITITSADEKFLRNVMEKIEAGIPEPEFTVEKLEKELAISHTHFYRKIKSLTGYSGKELLQNIRLKRAANLLSQDKLRISEIAYMTGFNNPKYFSKCFKEKYGVTPTEFVEKQK